MWQSGGGRGGGGGGAATGMGGADLETRTSHNFVGKKSCARSLRRHTSSMSSSRTQIPSCIDKSNPNGAITISSMLSSHPWARVSPLVGLSGTQCRDCQEMDLCRQSDHVPVPSTRSLPNSHKPLRHGLNDQDACEKKIL